MKKLAAVIGGVAAVATIAVGVFAGVATADESGVGAVACAEASVRVQTAAEAAVAAGDELAKANAAILTGLQANLAAAEKDQAAKLKTYQDALADTTSTASQIQAAQDALVAAQLKVQQAAKALEDAAPPSALKDKLVTAQAALKVAIDRRLKACDFVQLPTVTVTPTPTVTVTPTPTFVPRIPSAINTGKP